MRTGDILINNKKKEALILSKTMKTISSRQLAYILKTEVGDQDCKILTIKDREKGINTLHVNDGYKLKGQTIEVKAYEKYYGVDIFLAIDSIKKNYLKHTATRSFIMDYPAKKLVVDKTGKYPVTVQIPSVLKTFLTVDQIEEILTKWREIYATHQAVEKFGTIFK